ncbi:MAG TPA: hypothetical protein VGN20_03955 [Mucilaginibacter sp.]
MLLSLNSFVPFESDVWGTVSDWAMVIVTGITAIFIYRTFRAQLKVTKDQTELLKIEQIRLREQFRTEIDVSGGNEWTSVNTFWVNIKAINHNAFNLKIKIVRASGYPLRLLNEEIVLLKMENWVGVIKQEVNHEDLKNEYEIQISYEDANGKSYIQIVTGIAFDERPKISPPIFVRAE